jgi:hypothetical protein
MSNGTLGGHMKDVVFTAMEYTPEHRALVLFDTHSALARRITEAYREAIPEATFVDFHETTPEEALRALNSYGQDDLVVLVQSGSFRLNEFRLRVELFKLGIKVIEHGHVGRIPTEEILAYEDALAYDASYYRTLGPKMKALVDAASTIVVESEGGGVLTYEGGFEDTKLNIGDYTGMKNVGGQFPIGEVFTEPKELVRVNGTVSLYAFGNKEFRVEVPERPMMVTVKEGMIVGVEDATASFNEVLAQIQEDETLTVRELGFGMNRAFTRTRRVIDVGAYERMCGVHLSLGGKHAIYAKPGFSRKHSRHHVDVFADVTRVLIDGRVVYENGAYIV